jgi:hypothetical protein
MKQVLSPDLFEINDHVAVLGTNVTARIIERRKRRCIGCGSPVYLLCSDDDEGEQFPCCEPAMRRLRLN